MGKGEKKKMLLTLSPSHRKTPCQHHAFPHIMPPPYSLTVPPPISWVHQSPPAHFPSAPRGVLRSHLLFPRDRPLYRTCMVSPLFILIPHMRDDGGPAGGIFRAPAHYPYSAEGHAKLRATTVSEHFSACDFIFLRTMMGSEIIFPRTI